MKIFKLKKYLPFLVFPVVFAIGCSDGGQAPQKGAQMPPSKVETVTVEAKEIPYTVRYIARTEGSKTVDVRAQVSGILKEKKYTEGEFVKAGKVMFVIEPETYKAALGQAQGSLVQAEANVKQSKLNFDRAQNLYNQKAISKKDYDAASAAYDTAKGQLEVAKSAVDNAKILLGYTYVKAPVSGYSGKTNYSEGNLISSASPQALTVINQVDPIYVNFSVPSSTVSFIRTLSDQKKLKQGKLTVNLYLEDGSLYGKKGNVTFFDKQVSTATGDIKVRAEFVNDKLILLPGQFVTAELLGFTLTNAIMVPQKALVKMGTKTMVIVVDENNTAHYREVSTTASIGNDFLISEGLKVGERVVVEGQNKVAEGAPVQIISGAGAVQGQ